MPPRPLDRTSSILIVGGGAWGCSTALHLGRRGYENVKVLDPYAIPSPIAAGSDVNKIMEHKELKDGISDAKGIAFATCTRAALKGWKTDPVFAPYFHETGFIIAGHTPDLGDYVALNSPDDFRATMPPGVLTGDFPGWKGWISKSMISAYTEAKRLGVTFIESEMGDVIGARTADGVVHHADHMILAAGAGSDSLLDFKKQLRPTAWTLSHIRMTPEEAQQYRNLPVLFNIAKGFFMEPDEHNHELKICDEHPGYCNFIMDPNHNGATTSVPFARNQIPLEAEARARDFLRDIMPHLADRPFVSARICWDADTPDRAFLIDRHPEYGSLLVAVGGSGNGAMQMPSIGGFIADGLEGRLVKELKDVVRWRSETAVGRDWHSTQGRRGGPNKVIDFQDVKDNEWTQIHGAQGGDI
ncbi:FAD dependent oxidoreductase [Aspergillus cavernicola]|uniref:FAD dependent oxidoreductase n=1 Tax=Aspergillus cavernicola TaxID=176166 RepID=A0ABR4HQI9_9EURO